MATVYETWKPSCWDGSFPKIWEIRRTALYHVTANPLPSLHLLCSIMLPCYCERGNIPKESGQGTVSVWRCFVLIVLKSAKAIVQFSTIRQAFIAELYVIVSSARSPPKKLWVQTHVERKDTKAEVLTPFQMYRYYWCTMMQQSFCTSLICESTLITIINGRKKQLLRHWGDASEDKILASRPGVQSQ